jgi:hypothetical protein
VVLGCCLGGGSLGGAWVLGYLGAWLCGCCGTWVVRYLGGWCFGLAAGREDGLLLVLVVLGWLLGCLGGWLCGCVAVWLCSCVVVWLCGTWVAGGWRFGLAGERI